MQWLENGCVGAEPASVYTGKTRTWDQCTTALDTTAQQNFQTIGGTCLSRTCKREPPSNGTIPAYSHCVKQDSAPVEPWRWCEHAHTFNAPSPFLQEWCQRVAHSTAQTLAQMLKETINVSKVHLYFIKSEKGGLGMGSAAVRGPAA